MELMYKVKKQKAKAESKKQKVRSNELPILQKLHDNDAKGVSLHTRNSGTPCLLM
jgi:hypothetical protein